MSTLPQGAVAILTRPDGVVMATACDFEPEISGHRDKFRAQEYRARQALANAMLRGMCHADIADTMRGYDAEQVMQSLVRLKGYRVTVEHIGGEADE